MTINFQKEVCWSFKEYKNGFIDGRSRFLFRQIKRKSYNLKNRKVSAKNVVGETWRFSNIICLKKYNSRKFYGNYLHCFSFIPIFFFKTCFSLYTSQATLWEGERGYFLKNAFICWAKHLYQFLVSVQLLYFCLSFLFFLKHGI